MSKRQCYSCNPSFVSIGGLSGLVHERGCPDEWRDSKVSCFECGYEFTPESRHQRICDDCQNPMHEDDDEQA